MNWPINLDYQHCVQTNEIDNKCSDGMLAAKFGAVYPFDCANIAKALLQ
jgi:hypothetical protein